MSKVSKGVFSITAAVLGFQAMEVSRAGTFVPLPVTSGSYNQDVVVEAAAGTGGFSGAVTATMDGGTLKSGNTWMERGLDTANTNAGLPAGAGTFTVVGSGTALGASAGDQYTFAPYNGNNVVLLNSASTTGTLTLTTPTRASVALSFLTSSGNASGTFTFTVNFSDGAPAATGLTSAAPDWFNGSPAAYVADGRVQNNGSNNATFNAESGGTHGNDDGGNPRLYAEVVTLPAADQGHLISSIQFTAYSGGGNTAVFGVSTGIPEPTTLGLLGLGGLGLLARRRRNPAAK